MGSRDPETSKSAHDLIHAPRAFSKLLGTVAKVRSLRCGQQKNGGFITQAIPCVHGCDCGVHAQVDNVLIVLLGRQ